MSLKIALAGNPNCGKTTLFNLLTGSNQYVGNWPGVTVEKKEGKLKNNKDVIITDLPGIYSLSPYTLEEVVARNYLLEERPDVILNIVDGSNLERNLYLTTQLVEIGIPVVLAVNMMDIVEKKGDKIDIDELSRHLGCTIVKMSALKGKGIDEVINAAIDVARNPHKVPYHSFCGPVEHALAHIEEALLHDMPDEQQRWYAIKIFERDNKVLEKMNIPLDKKAHIENDIKAAEEEMNDDAESIITNERYIYIAEVIHSCYQRRDVGSVSTSDKIDRIVTNRFLGLPIFAVVMFIVFWIAMVGVGGPLTDWANDGLFGEGFHLFGIDGGYDKIAEEYKVDSAIVEGYNDYVKEHSAEPTTTFTYKLEDEETLEVTEEAADLKDYAKAKSFVDDFGGEEPNPADYGIWIPGIPVLLERGLDAINAAEWLKSLILDGIVAGVGAVLGFVPQLLILFLLLAFLESCGYMTRIAFILDRFFRKIGLSGKSFIPMLVGVGCGVPGIMASRTIENEKDRRMTIITTTFIPCSAKLPLISMIAGALFGGSVLIAISAYFMGMAAIVISAVMLKKSKVLGGEPAPFVMELPPYHMPLLRNVLQSMWERGWSFIKKAGTVILVSTIVIWFATYFGFTEDGFRMLDETEFEYSLLGYLGKGIAWIFVPLGWGDWRAAVASLMGIVAKENVVGTIGVLYGGGDVSVWNALSETFNSVSGYSFLVFNLLCAPCVAAIAAIKSEMKSLKWTFFAIGYQCLFAYAIALMINQFGSLFTGNFSIIGLVVALLILLAIIYTLFIKKYKKDDRLKV